MKFIASLLFALLFGTGAAFAADLSTPEGVVKEMYGPYFDALNAASKTGAETPDVIEQVTKFATPALAARLAKAVKSDEMVIDWDFLIDGQDWQDLKLISVKTTASDATTATVHVETSNSGTVSQTDVKLVKAGAAWQVSDFVFWVGAPDSTTLDKILKDAGF